MDYTQTKRMDDRPWCGGDVNALGLGTAMIWVMLEAISATHHGRPIFPENCDSRESNILDVGRYVGLVRF